MTNVAINGLGRIGRAALKIILDMPELNLVAANDVATAENLAYLLRYDTVYGRYEKPVKTGDGQLIIGGKTVRLLSEKDPAKLPWKDLKMDLVFECTGRFTKQEDLEKHIQAGAKRVILSAPSKSEEVVSAVHGVNHPEGNPIIISCASCTTNCIAPVAEIMARRIGVKKAIMTTVHAYTADQILFDGGDGCRRALWPRPVSVGKGKFYEITNRIRTCSPGRHQGVISNGELRQTQRLGAGAAGPGQNARLSDQRLRLLSRHAHQRRPCSRRSGATALRA
jgi:glyceraldehyde-3-phosphate dehydrogenase/erythrose-4-phosphate dehydrogenase